MDKNTFTVSFTTAELLCAATALGIATLPQSIKLPKQLTGPELQIEIDKGYESLQKRKLIHSLSPLQWQIDNLLVVLVQWMVAPDYLLQLEIWQRNGKQQRETIYFWQNEALLLQSSADQNHFTFFKSSDRWVHRTLEKFGPVVNSTNDDCLSVPQLNLVAFLHKVQQNPVDPDSVSILRRAGLSSERSKQTLAKLATVTQAATLTWQNRTFQNVQSVLFLFTPECIWGGEDECKTATTELHPLSEEGLIHLLTFNDA